MPTRTLPPPLSRQPQYAAEITVDAGKVAEAKRKARAIEGGDEDEDDEGEGEQKH